MNQIDRLEIEMRLGRKLQEAEARSPGGLYSPGSGSLLVAAALFIMLSVAATFVIVKTEIWIGLKILTGILGVVWFLMAWRGVARVVYRAANHRDW